MNRGKKYNELNGKVDKSKKYSLEEGLKLVKELKSATFVEAVEAVVVLTLSENEKKQGIKSSISYPNSFGKTKKVIVFAEDKGADDAKAAGADEVGMEDLVKKIQDGWTDFDVVIATPQSMPKIAALGKELGPKGLMPNPKNGTITENTGNAVKEFKAGKTNFKSDANGIVHASIGHVDMPEAQIEENLRLLIKKASEAAKKGPSMVIEKVYVGLTMSPSIQIDTEELV